MNSTKKSHAAMMLHSAAKSSRWDKVCTSRDIASNKHTGQGALQSHIRGENEEQDVVGLVPVGSTATPAPGIGITTSIYVPCLRRTFGKYKDRAKGWRRGG